MGDGYESSRGVNESAGEGGQEKKNKRQGAQTYLVPILVMQQQHSRASGQQMTARQTARKKPIVGPIGGGGCQKRRS
jgi:hypothetical protein